MGSVALILVLFSQANSDDNIVQKFLNDLSLKRATFAVLKADLRVENITPDEKTESHGTLLFLKPNRLVFRISMGKESSEQQVFLVDNTRLYEYDPSLEQVQVYDLSENNDLQVILFAFQHDATTLEEHYRVGLFEPGDAGERASRGLLIEPKNQSEEEPKLFERIRIYLRDRDLLPTLIHVINDADSEAIMYLDNIQTDAEVQEHEDQIAARKGAALIENGQKVRTVIDEIEYIPEPALGNRPISFR